MYLKLHVAEKYFEFFFNPQNIQTDSLVYDLKTQQKPFNCALLAKSVGLQNMN